MDHDTVKCAGQTLTVQTEAEQLAESGVYKGFSQAVLENKHEINEAQWRRWDPGFVQQKIPVKSKTYEEELSTLAPKQRSYLRPLKASPLTIREQSSLLLQDRTYKKTV